MAFVSPGFTNMAQWEVLQESCESDHIIRMELESHVRYEDLCDPRCLFQRADWAKFVFLYEKNLQAVDFGDSRRELSSL